MKKLSSTVLISLIIMLLASCNFAPRTEPPAIVEPASISIENTDTPVPPTEAPSSTPTVVPVTETPSSTLTPFPPTETPTITPAFPSQTAKAFTQSIVVDLPNLSGSFNVRTGTQVTISDRGSDRKVNNCTISKLGAVVATRYIPLSGPSNPFTLAFGTYILNCGQRSNATIYSE